MKKKKQQSLTQYLTSDGPDGASEAAERAKSPESGDQSAKKAAKKAARREKKAERKRRRAIRRHENAVLYIPERMKGFPLSVALGYLLRFFSIAFSIFGIAVLLADSFLTTKIGLGWLLLYGTVCVSAFSLIFIGKKQALAGVGLLAGTVGLLTLIFGSPAAFYLGGFAHVFNQSMDRLKDAGFASAGHIDLSSLGSVRAVGGDLEAAFLYGGMFLIITLLALIFSAFSAKRTRLFPMLILGGGLCVICFTYNLCESNFGIACVLAGLCSAIVLSTYDKIYAAHKKSRKSRAYSGFASSLSGLLAFSVLLAPAANFKNPWRDIPFISEPMNDLRMIVTTLLTGGNPKLNVMNSLTQSKDTSLESPEFDGTELFRVSSYIRYQNIYLRSWIGNGYDYSTDSWSLFDDDDYRDMQNHLRGVRSDYTGDQASYQLALLFNNWIAADALPTDSTTGSNTLGYYFSFVDVEYTGNTGLLYVLPSSFIPSVGLYEHGSRTERYGEAFNLYSDGVYRSSWGNLRKSYTAPALIPTYKDPNFAQNAQAQAEFYELLRQFFSNSSLEFRSEEEVTSDYTEFMQNHGLENPSVAPLQAFLTARENKNWLTWRINSFDSVKQYSDYVKENYTTYPEDSEGLRQIAAAIRPDLEAATTEYDRIMSVINYLILNYKYTTTPTPPSGSYGSDLDAFLLETKDGYCVQFATAAALLLRSFGIPARYVQGYIADGKRVGEDSEGNVNYNATVIDSNAHAWIEVWMDGLGWRTFEVTPPYYLDLYNVPTAAPGTDGESDPPPIWSVVAPSVTETEPAPSTTRPPQTTAPAVTTEPQEEPVEEESTFDPQMFFTFLGVAVAAAGIALLVLWRIRKAKKVAAGRKYFIERAIFGNFEDQADLDLVSGTLADGIYAMMKILGKVPKLGESPDEFARRVDHPPKPDGKSAEKAIRRQLLWAHTFTEVTAVLEKREFSGHADRADLTVLGEFLESIERIEYPALPLPKKLLYRYILCEI